MKDRIGPRARALVALAAALATAPTMVAAPAKAAVPAGEYQVGFITDSTGPLAAAGVSYQHGAQLAVEEISASGYMGQGAKLALSEKEAAGEPARAIQDMNQFLADRRVVATSCCILSAVAGSLKPIVTGKIPLVIYGASAPGLPSLPWIYNVTSLPGPKEVVTATHVAKALGSKTAAYFVAADNDAFKGRMAAAQKALEEMGVKTAGVVNVLGSDTDFTGPATQAMGMQPDLMLVFATQTPAAGIVATLRGRGWTKTIVANDALAPEPVFKKIGAALADVPFPIAFSADVSNAPEAKAFVAAYQKKFSATPDLYSAQGYEAMWMIAQAMRSLDAAPTRESVAKALSGIKEIEHNVYGGLAVTDGQAATKDTLIVTWSAEGKLVPWAPPK